MSLLFETIKLENGKFFNLEYHQARMGTAFRKFYPGQDIIDLNHFLSKTEYPKSGLYRCRIDYNSTIQNVNFYPYKIRDIQTLKLISDNQIEYAYKYSDRSYFERLIQQKGTCDEIIIVKNGLITDTTFSNLVFFDGEQWYTPSTPLLRGTKRQYLLDKGLIYKKDIRLEDLEKYQSVCLINAMLDLDLNSVIDLDEITINNLWDNSRY